MSLGIVAGNALQQAHGSLRGHFGNWYVLTHTIERPRPPNDHHAAAGEGVAPPGQILRGVANLPHDIVAARGDATLAALVERGVRREVERLEKANGGPFPQRPGALVGGRPRKDAGD